MLPYILLGIIACVIWKKQAIVNLMFDEKIRQRRRKTKHY